MDKQTPKWSPEDDFLIPQLKYVEMERVYIPDSSPLTPDDRAQLIKVKVESEKARRIKIAKDIIKQLTTIIKRDEHDLGIETEGEEQ